MNGGRGADTVNISGLTSEHRLVFNAGGGNDQVIGDLRPQDVVNMGNGRGDSGGSTRGPDTHSLRHSPIWDALHDAFSDVSHFRNFIGHGSDFLIP